MLSGKWTLLAVLAAITVASPGAAQDASQTNAQPHKKVYDPNEVVCEKTEVLGSRLATKKVCMTRAQWAEQRQQDRDEIDRDQKAGRMRGE
jgi:invasion protein IalB